MAKRRIAQYELAVGKQLVWDVYDSDGRLLLSKGQKIDTTSQLEGLIERGLYTEGEFMRGKGADVVAPVEQKSALALVLEARRRLALVCAQNSPKENFAEQIGRIVQMIREGCKLNRDVALASILLHRETRYSIRHSVDAALVSHIVGSFIGMQEDELQSVTSAALTMNISMLSMQDDMQSHAEPLAQTDRQILQRHPDESLGMLYQYGVTDDLWLQAVQDHHESIDGSGYPAQKTSDDLLLPTRLVTLSDIYCTRVSGRDYRPPLRPNDALRNIFLGHGISVEAFLAAQFIKALGVFPPGAPVRLNNGEIAIVIQQGEKANIPIVCAVINAQGVRLATPIRRETRLSLYGIHEALDLSALGTATSMQALWGKDAIIF